MAALKQIESVPRRGRVYGRLLDHCEGGGMEACNPSISSSRRVNGALCNTAQRRRVPKTVQECSARWASMRHRSRWFLGGATGVNTVSLLLRFALPGPWAHGIVIIIKSIPRRLSMRQRKGWEEAQKQHMQSVSPLLPGMPGITGAVRGPHRRSQDEYRSPTEPLGSNHTMQA